MGPNKLNAEFDEGEWRRRAACRDTDPDLFFPTGTVGNSEQQIETAKAICRTCLVQAQCLDFALVTNQEDGVWGGTDEEERRKLRRNWVASRRAG